MFSHSTDSSTRILPGTYRPNIQTPTGGIRIFRFPSTFRIAWRGGGGTKRHPMDVIHALRKMGKRRVTLSDLSAQTGAANDPGVHGIGRGRSVSIFTRWRFLESRDSVALPKFRSPTCIGYS